MIILGHQCSTVMTQLELEEIGVLYHPIDETDDGEGRFMISDHLPSEQRGWAKTEVYKCSMCGVLGFEWESFDGTVNFTATDGDVTVDGRWMKVEAGFGIATAWDELLSCDEEIVLAIMDS